MLLKKTTKKSLAVSQKAMDAKKSTKLSHNVKKTNKQKKLIRKTNQKLGRYKLVGGGENSAVILLWINDTIKTTLYKGNDVDSFLSDFKIAEWNAFKHTYPDQLHTNIFFFYDSSMVSSSPDEINTYVSEIQQNGITCIDIRKGVLVWLYKTYILRVINQRYGKSEGQNINDFLGEYLPKSKTADNKEFSGLKNISVPDDMFNAVQKIDLFEFINTILFSENTPVYFRVDILRVIAQLYVSALQVYTKILAIDMDIAPKNERDDLTAKTHNAIINILLNPYTPLFEGTPQPVADVYSKIHANIKDEHKIEKIVMIMINSENSLTLLSLSLAVHQFYRQLYLDCLSSILVISPILIYLNFLRNPSVYDMSGIPIRNIGNYIQLKCQAFSQIVYGFYPMFNMLYKLIVTRYSINPHLNSKYKNSNYTQWADKTGMYFTYNSNKLTTAFFDSDYETAISDYKIASAEFKNVHGNEMNDVVIKNIKIAQDILDMPVSQFHDASPCNKLSN